MNKAFGLALVAALAYGSGSAAGGTATGLRGKVMRGPTQRARRRTRKAGTASPSGPGRYAVSTANPRVAKSFTPKTATVPKAGMKRQDFDIDTGLR